MAKSLVGLDNLHLEGAGILHVFGNQALLDGEMKAVNTFGFFVQTKESIVGEIEAIIAEDLQTHPVEAIDHILVGPYVACLLFLDGRIGREQVSGATDNGSEIVINGVMLQAGDEERSFKIVVRNGYDGYATMNKIGEVL